MKKIMMFLPAGLILAACAPSQSGPAKPMRDAFTLSANVNGEPVQATETAAGWMIMQPNYSLLVDFSPSEDGFRLGQTPTQGFLIGFTNSGKIATKVIWDETTVVLRGRTSGVIPDGVKYIDAERSKPPLIVPPSVTSVKQIVPATLVEWDGKKWYTWPMFPANIGKSNVTLYIGLETDKKEGITLNFIKK